MIVGGLIAIYTMIWCCIGWQLRGKAFHRLSSQNLLN